MIFSSVSFANISYILIQMFNGIGITCQCGTHIQVLTNETLRLKSQQFLILYTQMKTSILKVSQNIITEILYHFLKCIKVYTSPAFYNAALILGLYVWTDL